MINYTTTSFKTRETIGDTPFFNTMSDTATMTITPNSGYVVSASSFSVPKLPSDILSVSFTDTDTAGSVDNLVTITATFKQTFTVTDHVTINLNILGDATFFIDSEQTISANVRLIDDKNENSFGSVSITSFEDTTVTTTKQVGINGNLDIFTTIISNDITKNVTTKLASVTVTADTNYYFVNKPYLKRLSTDNVFLKQTSVTRDANKKATAYNFDVMFNSKFNTYAENQQPVFIEYTAKALPVEKTEITRVVFGDTNVSDLGETRPIRVYGTEGAEFNLTIVKESDKTKSIINDPINTENIFTETGTIASINKKIPRTSSKKKIGYCDFVQKFPMNTIRSTQLNGAMSASTTMNVDSNADVAVGDRVIMGKIDAGKTIKVTELNPGSVANRLTLSSAITASDDTVVKFIRNETYNINIYPKDGVTLGTKVPLTKPFYTIKQNTNPVLTLAATTSYAADPGNTTYAGRVGATPDILSTLPIAVGGTRAVVVEGSTKNRFKLTYTFTATNGAHNWAALDGSAPEPKWSSTLERTTLSTGATLSPSHWTNSAADKNGGTKLEIHDMIASGLSTNELTLVLEITVLKFGTDDVTCTLQLDDIFRAS